MVWLRPWRISRENCSEDYGGLRRRKNQPGSETCLVECQNGAPRLITRQNDKEQDCIGGICIFFRHVVIESDTRICVPGSWNYWSRPAWAKGGITYGSMLFFLMASGCNSNALPPDVIPPQGLRM